MLGLLRSQSNCDLSRKLRSPACCYRERSKPPYVSYCYGITWDDVRILEEDGKVPAVAHPMAAGRPIEREWERRSSTARQIRSPLTFRSHPVSVSTADLEGAAAGIVQPSKAESPATKRFM